MRQRTLPIASIVASLVATFSTGSALAQEPDPIVDEAATAADPGDEDSSAKPRKKRSSRSRPESDEGWSSGSGEDGVRFRGGISGGAGAEILTGGTTIMGGVDGRVGVQINHLIGVYAQPQLSFGSFGGALGITGTFTTTAVVDFTFIDHLLVGAGGGFGVFNNPTGPVVHLRAGGYPLMGHGEDGIRRKGLMLAFDMRLGFITGDTVVYPMGSIGYEAF